MGKVLGILMMVAVLWTAIEIYTKGSADAFGGILARTGLADTESPAALPVTRRAGAKVAAAQAEAEARRNRLLAE